MSKKSSESEEANNGVTLFSDVFFDIPRHNLITGATEQLLSAKAKAKVDELLASVNMSFATWGGWADKIKSANPPNDNETKKFLQNPNNKSHRTWHYVDLPLGSQGYQQAAQLGFTRPDDVVQTIKKCVLVLKGQSTRFSRVNALRLVGHLVGDIHQPLHVGCGFIDKSVNPPKLISDPQIIVSKNLKSDTGGNNILLPGAGNLHSFWDGSLSGNVDDISLLNVASSTKRQALVKKLVTGANKLEAASSGGVGLAAAVKVEDWALDWANESLGVAVKAYKNIVITGKQGGDFKVSWEGKEAYIKRCRPLILNQMKLAVRHLTDLLNEIWK